MACQGTPTATQYQTSVGSSFAERTVYSTLFVDTNGPLKARQDSNDSASTPTLTFSDSSTSSSSSDGGFEINEVSTTIQTITLTDTIFFTNTIPIQTLYAPCSTSDSTSESTSSKPTSIASSSTSVSLASDILTDLAVTTVNPDGKATTTSGGVTIVISQFYTTVNGVRTIYATPIQTLLNTSNGTLNDGQRTAVVAGSAVGAVCILVALLGLLFYVRRTRQVRQRRLEEKQAKERPPRHLLEDEADDFHFASRGGPPMMAQHWDSTSFTSGGSSSAPRLLRARGSRTGSLFQEDVWPPPSEVMEDPLLTSQDLGSSISLAMGYPEDGSSTLQPDVSPTQLDSAPAGVSSADAYAFGAVPMAGHLNQQRSSAYESIRSVDSADYYYHGRSQSAEPLLDDPGRTISHLPVHQRSATLTANRATSPTSPNNTMDRRTRKSNLRVSYTADNADYDKSPTRLEHFRSGTGMSGQSAGSFSPRTEMQSSPEEGGMHGMIGESDTTGTVNERREELPPMYHTIPRDAS